MIRDFFKKTLLLVLLGAGIISASALADWTAPLATAPTCTSGNPGCDAPVNVSTTSQRKLGAFRVDGVFRTDSETILSTLGGNVGIGTLTPSQKLDLQGNALINGRLGIGSFYNSISGIATPLMVSGSGSFRTNIDLFNSSGASKSASILMSSGAVGTDSTDTRWWNVGTDWNGVGNTNGTGNNFWIWNGHNTSIGATRMFINPAGNTGFGPNNTDPRAIIDVKGGDIYVNDGARGIVLRSWDSGVSPPSCYRLRVNMAGTLSTQAITCP